MSEEPPNLNPEDQSSSEEQNDAYKASVPFMITGEMKRQLRELGVTPAKYKKMTPEQAWEKIKATKAMEANSETVVDENEPGQPDLSPEQQLAREKVVELLNHEQAKLLENKKPGKEALTDMLIQTYEAMREAAQTGDFDKVTILGTGAESGSSVKDFVRNIYEQSIHSSNRLAELADKVEYVDQQEVKDSDQLYDLAQDAIDALEKLEKPASEPIAAERHTAQEAAGQHKHEPEQDDGGNDNEPPEVEEGEPEQNPWLDPRLIQELKSEFDQKYAFMLRDEQNRRKRLQDDTPIPVHFRDIVKTHVIESRIRRSMNNAKYVKEKYGVGKILERPSETIMQQMAAEMDKSEEELANEALKMQKHVDQEHFEKAEIKFKKGQEVQHLFERQKSAWLVEEAIKSPSGTIRVKLINKDDPSKEVYYPQDELLEEQDWASPQDVDQTLERVKKYFGKPVVVKMPSGEFVLGKVGFSTTHNKVQVAGEDGNWLTARNSRGKEVPQLFDVDEFLSWQKEVADSEKKFQIGQEVTVEKNGELQDGWKVEGFAKETTGSGSAETEHVVVIVKKDGAADGRIAQDQLEKWKQDALQEKLGKFRKSQKVKVRDTEDTQWLDGYTFVEYSPDKKAVIIAGQDGKPIPIMDLELFIKWQEDPSGDDSIKEDEPEPAEDEGEPTSAPDTEPAISAAKPEHTRKERRKKKREEKYARQDERDKALNERLARVGGKWEQQSLFKRLALTGPLGFFAAGAALSTMPGWLLTYRGGKSFTDKQVRLMHERQAREEAEEGKAREKAERESRKKKKDDES